MADQTAVTLPFIVRHPVPAVEERRQLESLPSQDLDKRANWQVDVHSADLTALDLRDRLRDLLYADFDSRTAWPALLPNGFSPARVMELGKNPGLGLRKLHAMGITGKGVGVAVIDAWALLVDHMEFRDRLRFYDEMPPNHREARTHATAVASLAVGKMVGVAPEADLYFIGVGPHPDPAAQGRSDYTWPARALDRLVELNTTLRRAARIRVVALPMGWPAQAQEIRAAADRAREAGIFVVSCSLEDTYSRDKLLFNGSIGMGRDPLADPDDVNSYGPCYYSMKEFAQSGLQNGGGLLVPMDSRGAASATGTSDYLFCRHGGSSWTVPYAAGLYALACQVTPDVTPARFWEAAVETGDCIPISLPRGEHPFGKIVNPKRLLERLKR